LLRATTVDVSVFAVLSCTCLTCFVADVFATTGRDGLLGDWDCATCGFSAGWDEAIEALSCPGPQSAEPIAGAKAKAASVAPTRIFFMNHLLSTTYGGNLRASAPGVNRAQGSPDLLSSARPIGPHRALRQPGSGIV